MGTCLLLAPWLSYIQSKSRVHMCVLITWPVSFLGVEREGVPDGGTVGALPPGDPGNWLMMEPEAAATSDF